MVYNIFSPLNVTLTFITVAFVIPTIVGKKAFGLKCNFAIRYGFKKETYIFYKPVEWNRFIKFQFKILLRMEKAFSMTSIFQEGI